MTDNWPVSRQNERQPNGRSPQPKRRKMTTDTEEYIQNKITSGQFRTRDEFVDAAISTYRDLDEFQALRAEIQRRLEASDRGSVSPLDMAAIKAELIAELQPAE